MTCTIIDLFSLLGTWLWILTVKHALFLCFGPLYDYTHLQIKSDWNEHGNWKWSDSGSFGSFHKFQEKGTTVMQSNIFALNFFALFLCLSARFFMLLSVFNLKNVNANRFNESCVILKLSLPRPDWIHSTTTIQQTATDSQHASITSDQVCSHVCNGILEKSWFVRRHGKEFTWRSLWK